MDYKVGQVLAQYRINGLTDPQSLSRINQIGDEQTRAEAVANQLESTFMEMMVKSMRETIPDDGAMDGKGLGKSQYVELLDQQYARMGGLPVDPRFHEALMRQILREPGKTSQALSQMQRTQAATSTVTTESNAISLKEARASVS